MKVLGIECTASPVSVSLLEDGKLKAEYFLNLKTTHSQTLLPMCESVLKLSGLTVKDVDAIAATVGPGSFTGVRIGISAVKGLAAAYNTLTVPVSVLEAMACNFLGQELIVCACMDARCSQVYNALFSVSGDKITRLCEDRALMIDEVYEDLKQRQAEFNGKSIIIVGDGADLFYNSVKDRDVTVMLAPEHLKYQRAFGVSYVGYNKALNNETVLANELLPLYLRLPQAERELKAKQEAKCSERK
ncbi:MAG: tRNA (adenosine(37)-N6)-threonylcarbamoyltransferase complex dimerization subunit type 1 TsaB [Clostridia bacterium]|nr:tRNA (adenosine(37)-N6)-threonylcarbamoyltransferase complex dimerization subunit type 1 TsaB [Clostridia bacterium]